MQPAPPNRKSAQQATLHWLYDRHDIHASTDGMRFGFSSGSSKTRGQDILTETTYLYRALVTWRTKP